MGIAALAEAFGNSFERGRRTPDEAGVVVIALKDGSPEWMRKLVKAVHGDMMPDDYVYKWIEEAALKIAEIGDDADFDEAASEFANDTEVYNAKLLHWVGSHINRPGYVEEAVEQFGPPEPFQFFNLLITGQSVEREKIFHAVVEELQQQEE